MGQHLLTTVAEGRAFMQVIDGKAVDAISGQRIDVACPSDGKVFASIPASGVQDVDLAVQAARRAFEEGPWARMPAVERGRLLARLSQLIEKNADELAALESRDTGKPARQGRADVAGAVRYYEFYGGACDKIHGDTIPFLDGYTALTLREPHGVVAGVIPWNYPLQILGRVAGAALAMGNTLVVKPAQGGSAQGVTVVAVAAELPRAMVDAYTYADVALIERKIEGVEVSVAVLDTGDGPLALPPVEIEPLEGAYTFDARYNAGETRFYVPARLEPDVLDAVCAAATAAHSALGLRHLSRVDLIVDADGVPWFLEANVLPGLTETSIMPQAIAASGRDLGDVYATLAAAAIADA